MRMDISAHSDNALPPLAAAIAALVLQAAHAPCLVFSFLASLADDFYCIDWCMTQIISIPYLAAILLPPSFFMLPLHQTHGNEKEWKVTQRFNMQ